MNQSTGHFDAQGERQCARMSKITNDGMAYRVLYSCTHMATVGVKWLTPQCKLLSRRLRAFRTRYFSIHTGVISHSLLFCHLLHLSLAHHVSGPNHYTFLNV